MSVVSSKFALLPDDDEDLNKKALRNKIHLKNGHVEQPQKKAENAATQKSKPKKNKSKKKNSEVEMGSNI